MSYVYNRGVYWPDVVRHAVDEVMQQAPVHRCCYSQHAEEAAKQDRFGPIKFLPPNLQLSETDVIEAELTETARVHKFLARVSMGDDRDLILVLMPRNTGELWCKTVWINKNTDRHSTLRSKNYIQNPG